jgi:hypothetical protein
MVHSRSSADRPSATDCAASSDGRYRPGNGMGARMSPVGTSPARGRAGQIRNACGHEFASSPRPAASADPVGSARPEDFALPLDLGKPVPGPSFQTGDPTGVTPEARRTRVGDCHRQLLTKGVVMGLAGRPTVRGREVGHDLPDRRDAEWATGFPTASLPDGSPRVSRRVKYPPDGRSDRWRAGRIDIRGASICLRRLSTSAARLTCTHRYGFRSSGT